ncbi:Txe/YoeB family addiction module toxin [Limibacterium fermenti]|jgi:toxin YoeB|uniref:Txe/YoeB family addiction module toxin n=1 Tax=Limibacterium fermenti TaxID=3229863 RepID=UPI000E822BDE|nr:Txe/YoeB family addiction module toxin [Porphyromonadaceae bacterium]
MYHVIFTPTAIKDVLKLKKSEVGAYKKLESLIDELKEHPYTGTGKPKRLSNDKTGQWSRRITHKHRLVYTVEEDRLLVLVLSSAEHYSDK